MYTESLFRAREQELIANGRRIAQIFQDSLLLFQPSILVRTRIEAIASTLGAEITVANREGLILTTLDESRAQRLRLSTSDVRTVLQEGTVVTRRGYEESVRSEEHTSELQSRENLVCRLLLEKKKK